MRRPTPGEGGPRRLPGFLEYPLNLVLMSAAWLLFAVPVVTWLTASVAMVHSLDRWVAHGDDRVLYNFWQGWRHHWRRTLTVGAASVLVLGVLITNLLFLVTQDAALAFVLLMGTVTLLLMWALLHLCLVPVIALFPQLPTGRWLRESFVLAFRHPLSLAGLVLCCLVVAAVLLALFEPLVFLGAGIAGYLALRFCYRHLDSAR